MIITIEYYWRLLAPSLAGAEPLRLHGRLLARAGPAAGVAVCYYIACSRIL